VFIVSGGLAEGVREFGLWLGLPEENIFAVEVEYNQLAGNWWETWKHPAGRNLAEAVLAHDGGPLTIGKGKAEIIRSIRRQHRGRVMLIGDGTSDLEASEAVDMFVGFGGVINREKVRAEADVFITTPALAPVLPLALARPIPGHALFQHGVELIERGSVIFRNAALHHSLLQRLR
jgi:phosphoserine phosphatase